MRRGPKLCVYDFDGTLFRSLRPPDDWGKDKKEVWWTGTQTLSPPMIPAKPGDEWWNQEVVQSFKRDKKDRGCVVLVVTGRKEKLRKEVGRLLNGYGLVPNGLFLNNTDLLSRDYKISELLRALRRYLSIEEIQMWEDNHDDLEHFRAFFEAQGMPFKANHVLGKNNATS